MEAFYRRPLIGILLFGLGEAETEKPLFVAYANNDDATLSPQRLPYLVLSGTGIDTAATTTKVWSGSAKKGLNNVAVPPPDNDSPIFMSRASRIAFAPILAKTFPINIGYFFFRAFSLP